MGNTLFKNIYNNKKVLITGNTGFKGGWLSTWLLDLGAEIYGLSDTLLPAPSFFSASGLQDYMDHRMVDVRIFEDVKRTINEIKPDFVFHLAAQALVKLSYKDPLSTFSTNILGTANLLEAIRDLDYPLNAVIITSDKCYDNVEWVWGYRENDILGGKDPYSASKGAAEFVIRSYANSFFSSQDSPVKVVSARAGNVIGGGDWAKDRIVPDCMRAWSKKKVVEIRNPRATRPWQHVLEPLSGYLNLGWALAENSKLNGEAFNFGPAADQDYTVGELIQAMGENWENIRWKDVSDFKSKDYEAGLLKLCCDKALSKLNWKPVLDFSETVKLTASWYKEFYEHPENNILLLTQKQINKYTDHAGERGLLWAKNCSRG